MQEVLEKLKGGLIVSCQALQNEPLHSSYIMQRMAVAAMQGGALGIRANSVEDIVEIKKEVKLPIIGIIKKEYADSQVYITPTMTEVDALAAINVDIIAVDATNRERPGGEELSRFIKRAKSKYPEQLFMADCANYEEALEADRLNFDIISTTLCGCTSYTEDMEVPNYCLLEKIVKECRKPIIAEGGIWEPAQFKKAMSTGILAAVIGTAITRPMNITKRFVAIIQK